MNIMTTYHPKKGILDALTHYNVTVSSPVKLILEVLYALSLEKHFLLQAPSLILLLYSNSILYRSIKTLFEINLRLLFIGKLLYLSLGT